MITLAYVTGYAAGWDRSVWAQITPLPHYTRAECEDYTSGFLMGARLALEADGVVIHSEGQA
jgi:hypothetical protein